jgi:hypothetical protein
MARAPRMTFRTVRDIRRQAARYLGTLCSDDDRQCAAKGILRKQRPQARFEGENDVHHPSLADGDFGEFNSLS